MKDICVDDQHGDTACVYIDPDGVNLEVTDSLMIFTPAQALDLAAALLKAARRLNAETGA